MNSLDRATENSTTETEQETHLSLEGDLKVCDYIQDIEPSEKTIQAVQAWAIRKQEQTKEKFLFTLAKMLRVSLFGSFLLVLNAQMNPNVDKNFTENVVTKVTGSQIGLLGTAFGAYIVHSIAQRKK